MLWDFVVKMEVVAGNSNYETFLHCNGKKKSKFGIFKLVNIILVVNIFYMYVGILPYGE